MKALPLLLGFGAAAVLVLTERAWVRQHLWAGRAWVSDNISAGRAWVRDKLPVRPRTPPIAGRATLGVHTLIGQQEDRSPALARTGPLQTAASGSSLLALVGGYAGNHSSPRDNNGNDWQPLGDPVVYQGYDSRFDVRAYLARNARGGPGHRVEVTKTKKLDAELTMPVVEIRDGTLTDVSQTYAPQGTRLTSGTVRTKGPAVLVAFWWGDGREARHTAVARDGFRVIEHFTEFPTTTGVQCAVAVREVDRAGEYTVTWETEPSQGAALWLFAFEHEAR